jgi:serine/threonine protein kinase
MPVLKQNEIFAGRYRLSRLLGEGGFSEVWKAEDLMADEAIVAIKIYAPTKGLDEWGLRQFRNEFTLTYNLSHPHLLKVHHYDIVDGSPYLIMPYCPYGSLTTLLREQGVLSERQLALVMQQIGSALDEIHRQDAPIVHQDIKPDNILLLQPEFYVLADFGISNRIRNTIQLDTSGVQTLTVAYAPPERFDRRPSSDTSGDIFSLGVTLYEMCTDTVPWEGAGGQCLLKGAAVPALPLRYSGELSYILEACMSPQPSQRPTAADIHRWGRRFLETGVWGQPGEDGQQQKLPVADLPKPAKEVNHPPKQPPAAAGVRESPLQQPTARQATPPPHRPPAAAPKKGAPKGSAMPSLIAALVALAILAGAGYWVYTELEKKAPAQTREMSTASVGEEGADEPLADPLQDTPSQMEAELVRADQPPSRQDPVASAEQEQQEARLEARQEAQMESRLDPPQDAPQESQQAARQAARQETAPTPEAPKAASPALRAGSIRQELQQNLNRISDPKNSRELRSGWKQEALARFADGSVRVLDESGGELQEYRAGIFLTLLLTSPHQVTVREVKIDRNNKITELRVSKDPIAAY